MYHVYTKNDFACNHNLRNEPSFQIWIYKFLQGVISKHGNIYSWLLEVNKMETKVHLQKGRLERYISNEIISCVPLFLATDLIVLFPHTLAWVL